MRLDIYLVENNYFKTRSKALNAIKQGQITVNGKTANKAGLEVSSFDSVTVDLPEYQFVSRGGYKLLGAINSFNLDLKGLTVLDIGASTGGFTDCCLQFGAAKVYAYDVGHDQLDQSLKDDVRVVSHEGINCRELTADDFADQIDFICMDVSFISCTKMFPAISSVLSEGKHAVVLFKPQFEVPKRYHNRQGIVTDDKIIMQKLEETIFTANQNGLKVLKYDLSPIKGFDGNKEYLLLIQKGS